MAEQNICYRKAIAQDAHEIAEIAQNLSRRNLEEESASEELLSASGFLLYPLAAQSEAVPNYKERIEKSSYFYVAIDDSTIVAFLMGYRFDEMLTFKNKTDNDEAALKFFVEDGHYVQSNIYLAQVGTHPLFKRSGVMAGLVDYLLDNIDDSPAVIAEIAQKPLLNKASTDLAIKRAGLRMVFTRPKDNGARISGTFIRTF